jgi:hypothetical protein
MPMRPQELRQILRPAADDLLDALPVSRDLLRVKEQRPELLEPISRGQQKEDASSGARNERFFSTAPARRYQADEWSPA